MKVVVCWEHSGEKKAAGRLADMVRAFITRKFPQIEVLTSHVSGGVYRNDAECLAAEAQRLLDEQEAAFAERPWWDNLIEEDQIKRKIDERISAVVQGSRIPRHSLNGFMPTGYIGTV